MTERIGKATREQQAHFLAFLVGEAGVFVVRFRVLEVYLLVRHVHIPTYDDGFSSVQRYQVAAEIILPGHTVVQPFQSVLAVGGIDINNEEVLHLQGDDAPLVVMLLDAYAVGYVLGYVLGEDGRTRIAFLFGVVPIGVVAWEIQVELTGLQFCFLQAKKIGIQRLKCLAEVLAYHGTQSVNVPTDKPHINSFFFDSMTLFQSGRAEHIMHDV